VDVDSLFARGWKVLTHEIGADRQLTMASVNQNGKLYSSRTSKVIQGIKCGTDGSPAEQYVIY
jgi:hypothetical protein